MRSKLREKAIRLRVEKRKSYSAIRKELGVPKSTLSYWLRDFPLSESEILELRRLGWKAGEAGRERYRNTLRKKKEQADDCVYKRYCKCFRKVSKDSEFLFGLALYLGEGAKKKESQLVLANTDSDVIRFFIHWCEKFISVQHSEFRFQLHLYENMDVEFEHKFWQNTLRVKRTQFYKPSIRKLKPHSFTYSSTNGHGTCSAYVFGTERNREVMQAMRAFTDTILRA